MRSAGQAKTINMTKGPMFLPIIRFILPLMATALLQQFYHSADIITVGYSPEPDAVGAIGSTSNYIALIRNLFIGFSVGANVVVAKYIGMKNGEKVSRAVHTSLCMSILLGFIGMLLGIAFARPVLVAMGLSGKLLSLALSYAYICMLALPVLSLTNFLSAILNAQGNAKTPLYVLSLTGLLNVGLNLLFVFAFGMSVEGVAIATAASNLASAVILWIYLLKNGGECAIVLRKLRFSRDMLREITRIGLPAGIQSSLFSLSNLLINASIIEVNNALTPAGSAYAPIIKANSVTSDIECFVFAALNTITTAASAFVAQNVGANDYRRVRSAFWQTTLVGVLIALTMSCAVVLLRDPLLALYGIVDGEDTLSHLAYYASESRVFLKWTLFLPFAVMNASAGTIRGMGKSTTAAMFAFFGTCVFRVIWIFTVFEYFKNLESIYISYPISWFITGGVSFVFAIILLRKKLSKDRMGEPLSKEVLSV